MKKQLISFIGGIACLGMISSAQALIIDDFVAPGHTLQSSPNVIGTVQNQQTQAGPIGGQRDFFIEVTGNGGSANIIGLNANSGSLSHNQGAQMSGTSTIQWDGNDADSTPFVGAGSPGGLAFGLGSVDLTEAGLKDAFGVVVVSNPSFSFNIDVKIFNDANNFAQGTVTVGALIATETTELVKFTDMVQTGTVDFAAVNAIEITFLNVTAGTSPSIKLIESTSSTPTPSSIALIGLGLAGMGFTRRKSKKA